MKIFNLMIFLNIDFCKYYVFIGFYIYLQKSNRVEWVYIFFYNEIQDVENVFTSF